MNMSKIFVNTVGLLGALSLSSVASACGPSENTLLNTLRSSIVNSDILEGDPDGKAYMRFSSSLDNINWMLEMPNNPIHRFSALFHKGFLYSTLEEALSADLGDTTYILEFDMNDRFRQGAVSAGYNSQGERLNQGAAFRCGPRGGSPISLYEGDFSSF